MPVLALSGSDTVWGTAPDDMSPLPLLCTDPVLMPWLPSSLPSAQYQRLHAVLKQVAGDPNGRTLLRAFATWAGAHGRTPDIVWREADGQAGTSGASTRASIGATHGVGWLVDVDYLADATPPVVLKTLGEMFKDMALVQSEPFYASLAVDHPLRTMDPALEQAWRDWVVSVPEGDRRDSRMRAIGQMRASLVEMRCYGGLCLGRFRELLTVLSKAQPDAAPIRASLDLSYLRLDSIPPIPAFIKALNLSGNAIADWRHLPASLRSLELRDHRGTWPETLALPAALVELDLSHSDLQRALADRPEMLRALERLATLSLAHTNIDTLPRLGSNVRSLDITGNRFREIPADLPAGLMFLYAARNPLEFLPATPDMLPVGLRCMFLRSASTAHLQVPVALQRNRNLSIDLIAESVWSSMQSEVLLRGLLRFLLRVTEGVTEADARRYREAAAQWDAVCGELFAAPARGGRDPTADPATEAEPTADGISRPALGHWREPTAFYSFLQRLEQVPAYRNHEAFRQGVRDWLVDLAFRPALRKTTLGACVEATETCDDRLVLAYNRLMVHRLNSDIEEGRLDEDIPRVIDIARQVYTLGVLTDVAAQWVHELRCRSVEIGARPAGRSRASTGPGADAIDGFEYAADGGVLDGEFIGAPDVLEQFFQLERRIEHGTGREFVLDEVEVHLAILCLVCPPDALDLWALAPERMALVSSQIDGPSAQATAMAEVRRRGEQEFLPFLVLDYPPWTGLLQRKAADAYAQADARRHAALETDYEAGVDAALRALALDAGDSAAWDDARKDVGPEVSRRMQLALLQPVTMGLLESMAASGAPVSLPFGSGAAPAVGTRPDAGARNDALTSASASASAPEAAAAGWRRV